MEAHLNADRFEELNIQLVGGELPAPHATERQLVVRYADFGVLIVKNLYKRENVIKLIGEK